MQIVKAEVVPVELKLRQPVRMAGMSEITAVTAIFVRLETRQGHVAWGCTVADAELTGEKPAHVLRVCREGAALAVDLHPTNLEYSLALLAPLGKKSPAALCAFDLALHDLLALAADMPLYRLLGGYRNRIQTSLTVPIAPVDETVAMACQAAELGFRMLKIKGGLDPDEDVRRVQAVHRVLPNHTLRLDADGGYNAQQALDVARALENLVEMIEQPTPAQDLQTLRQVKALSPIPILADQSLGGPESALELVSGRCADGLSIKLVSCGGLHGARQIDAIARVARLAIMVSCYIEPALLVAAGLSLALSSPNVHYGDLDGHLNLLGDPSQAGFCLQDGWLIAADVPGLGYRVEL